MANIRHRFLTLYNSLLWAFGSKARKQLSKNILSTLQKSCFGISYLLKLTLWVRGAPGVCCSWAPHPKFLCRSRWWCGRWRTFRWKLCCILPFQPILKDSERNKKVTHNPFRKNCWIIHEFNKCECDNFYIGQTEMKPTHFLKILQ